MIIQNNDLDFYSDDSYLDPTKIADYDINGDGTISTIKNEFTLGKGFIPIGTTYRPFEGSYDGKGKTIKALRVQDRGSNVGLFGAVYGHNSEFKNIVIDNAVVKGVNNVGALAGVIGGSAIKITLQQHNAI